ncbi:ABC transporter permease [Iamia sp. SCSIO 61187]|uniref:ABC transporter permease n=1 Tax=Iamia sp. SCSIO 61187 TaxID=2722752 RepID=UPI001C62B113|nr:ABC transporter permease [Iamia sp. SCSIO 61187]QYG91030.1 ABC transporter permease [Iamia sp. SCSIO 61187]
MRDVFSVNLLVSGIFLSTPLILAALGGLLSERAGVMNIALEGQMLFGAFAGVAVTWWVRTPWLGLLAAIGVGALVGGLHAFASVTLRADQIVSATAINLVAVGLTAALIEPIWGAPGASASIDRIGAIHLPLVEGIPFLGRVFERMTLLDWAGLLLVPLVWVVLFRTPFGMRMRSCGEAPEAAASVGIDVIRTRYQAVILSGVLAAVGGAYLSLAQVGVFQRNMTAGRGFLALAAMIFGKWRPVPVLGACLLFGLTDAFQLRAQTQGVDLPHDLLLALPYLIALVALATFVGRATAPAAIGKAYVRG